MLQDERTRDDVCLLVLSWAGPGFDRDLSADLSELSRTRRALDAWLVAHDVEPHVRGDVVLAASEAVANAAEHAYGMRTQERVRLSARVQRDGAGDSVRVEVRDAGRWRDGTASHERGRGLRIMSALMDVRVDTRASGTTVVLTRALDGAA